MLSGRSRRLPPPERTRIKRTKITLAGRAQARATTPAMTTRRLGSPFRTHIHPFPLAFRGAAPGSPRLLALPVAPTIVSPEPPARHLGAADGTRPRRSGRGAARLAMRALIPPALLFAVLVVPPQSLRATLVTLLIIAALGLVVWRLPMTDEE